MLLSIAMSAVACTGGGAPSPSPTGSGDVAEPGGRTSWAGEVPAPDFPGGHAWFNVSRPLSMADLRGKVVILDFWTLGCINCQHIIPDLKRLEDEFGDALVVIGVHSGKYDREHDDDSIREAIGKYGLVHPVVNDPNFVIWSTYAARAWPTLVIIDPAGNLVGSHAGEGVYPLFQPVVESLVKEFDARGEVSRTPLPLELEAVVTSSTVLFYPADIAVDTARDRLYIADSGHNRILVATLGGALLEVIGTGAEGFADGAFGEAEFRQPQGLALSPDGDTLYIADTRNHAVRAVDLSAKRVRTVAGTGRQLDRLPVRQEPAREVAMASPWDLVLVGDRLFVSMAGVHQLWMIDLTAATVEVYAGTSREGIDDGDRLRMATLAQPSGIDSDGEYLYWVDPESSSVRRLALKDDGEVETLVGTGLFDFGDADGSSSRARFEHPQGLAHAGGRLFVADTYNHKVKTVDPGSGETRTLVGDGSAGWLDGAGPEARLSEPGGITVAGRTAYIADTNNHLIRTFDTETGAIETLRLTNLAVAEGNSGLASRTVSLAAATAAPGGSTLQVTVATTPGFKLNSLGPSRLTLSSTNPTVASIGEDHVSFTSDDHSVTFPVPLILAEGSAELVAEGALYFCREGEEALCFVERLVVRLPLTVRSGATQGEVRLDVRLGGD